HLIRILLEIVKHPGLGLEPRVHVTMRAHAAPCVLRAIALKRTENLKERRIRSRARSSQNDVGQIRALHSCRRLDAAQPEQRRREIDMREHRLTARSRPNM